MPRTSKPSGTSSADTRAALETTTYNRYGELFPGYVWTDPETAVDLMAAEILTLRGELERARSAPEGRETKRRYAGAPGQTALAPSTDSSWISTSAPAPQPEEREVPSFGAALREARVASGLSLRDAALMLGTTTVRLGEVERGVDTRLRIRTPTPEEP